MKKLSTSFKPFRKDVPIYIASVSPKNIRLTGEIADGWIPSPTPLKHSRDARENIIRGAKSSERDASLINIRLYLPACVSDDEDLSKRQYCPK